jgi:hypothetical protein
MKYILTIIISLAVTNAEARPLPPPIPTPVAKPAPEPASTAKFTAATAAANPLNFVQSFALSDLQAALADAQGQTPPDTLSITCYNALIPIVQSQVANPLPTQLGAFLAVQKARDLKNFIANLQSPSGPLAGLNIACAPWLMDNQTTLIAIGAAVGLVIKPFPIP